MKSYTDYIVNTQILKQNAINIKSMLKNTTKFCAVVKANAYGLGMHNVVASLKNIADYFAVAMIKEAMSLRLYDKETKVLILGVVNDSDVKLCSQNHISISVSNLAQLKNYAKSNLPLNIHIQVNTGLNRFGFRSITEFKKALDFVAKNKNLHLEGVYSHFATKSNDVSFIRKQYFRFVQFKSCVKQKDVVFHISNSFATLMDSSMHLDMVRTGFLLYGNTQNAIGNYPVLTIKSHLVNVFVAKKGDTIGYDRTHKVAKRTKIGVVPIGYADGFDRRLSNNFNVLIKGKRCRVIGLVCMDVFMVDLEDLDVQIGDSVVLLGKSGKENITLDDYALALQTSPYEILLKFNYRRMNYIVV